MTDPIAASARGAVRWQRFGPMTDPIAASPRLARRPWSSRRAWLVTMETTGPGAGRAGFAGTAKG